MPNRSNLRLVEPAIEKRAVAPEPRRYGEVHRVEGRRRINRLCSAPASSLLLALGWPEQVQVANPQRGRQLIESDNRWVAMALLQAAKILLAKA